MKLRVDLKVDTSPEWIVKVLEDFDGFLLDHANCERKASSMAMSFIAKYPDRVKIIPELIETALEELEHYRDVYKIIESRGLQLLHKIPEDKYMKALHKLCHSGRNERFMDRMLIASVVETRGGERFRIVSESIKDSEMALFYKDLWICEAKDGHIFIEMALEYFDESIVFPRLEWWAEREAEIIQALPITSALH